MSFDDRITTHDGLTTAAASVDDKHNLRANKYRIVSSDSVLFTVSADTLRHLHALWNMAQSATGTANEVVLSDEDFEHSKSVRLLLDLRVNGIVGRIHYSLRDIGDVIDLTLKYDCRCGYELCVGHIELGITGCSAFTCGSENLCELFVLAAQLDELRLAVVVVECMASHIARHKHTRGRFAHWTAELATRVPPEHLRALALSLEEAFDEDDDVNPSFAGDAALCYENLLTKYTDSLQSASPKQMRGAECRAQKPWSGVPAKRPTEESQSVGRVVKPTQRGRGRGR